MTNNDLVEEYDHHHQDDIDHLLLTVLLPSFPPNRSQWKKLEHALHFINKSRSCSSEEKRKYFPNKTERGRGTETYYLESELRLDVRQYSVHCIPTGGNYYLSVLSSQLYLDQRTEFSHRSVSYASNNIKSAYSPGKLGNSKKMFSKDQISWSKLKHFLQQIM